MNTIHIVKNGAPIARLDRQGLPTFGYVGPQIIIASSKRPIYKFPHWPQFNFQPPSFPSMCASFIITDNDLTIPNIFQVTHGYSTSITSTRFLTAPSNPRALRGRCQLLRRGWRPRQPFLARSLFAALAVLQLFALVAVLGTARVPSDGWWMGILYLDCIVNTI